MALARLLRLALVLAPTVAFAAQPVDTPPAGFSALKKPANPLLRAAVQQRIQMMRFARISAALNLDVATSQKLFPVLTRYQQRLAPIHRQRAELAQRMKAELAAGKPDPAILNQFLDGIAANKRQRI